MMVSIRKDPSNRVTENDKATNPTAWVSRVNNYQASVNEAINAELIFHIILQIRTRIAELEETPIMDGRYYHHQRNDCIPITKRR